MTRSTFYSGSQVSVLLPVHNAEATIGAALTSLREQTEPPAEVILVNDGCTDRSVARAEAAWGDRAGLRVLYPGRVGLVAALQIGLAATTQPLVARMDADDIALPERLARQAEFLRNNPSVDILGSLVQGFADDAVTEGYRRYLAWCNGVQDSAALAREIFVESPLPHPSVMFRREQVLAIGGYQDHGWAEDYDLWLRAVLAGLRLGKVPEPLLAWRDGPGRASRVDARYGPDAFLRCKAHYLARGPLAGVGDIVVWGGTGVARKLGKLLVANGVRLAAFVDLDPRRVGGQRLGVPVITPEALRDRRQHFLLAVVGRWDARELIRERATALGWVEGLDFLCAA